MDDSVFGAARWGVAVGRAAIADWRASDLSMSAWARGHGVPLHRLIYWRDRLGVLASDDAHVPAMPFSRCVMTGAADGCVVDVGGAAIRVQVGFDAGLLRQVVEALV